MNSRIIGEGLAGLSTAYELSKAGHKVALFEKERAWRASGHLPGGRGTPGEVLLPVFSLKVTHLLVFR